MKLREQTSDDKSVVLGVILYSDSTQITQNGRDSAWPVYMTLANIPLHCRSDIGAFQLLGFIPHVEGPT